MAENVGTGTNNLKKPPTPDLIKNIINLAKLPGNHAALLKALSVLPSDKALLVQDVLNGQIEVPCNLVEDREFMEIWRQQYLLAEEMYSRAKPFSIQENMAIAGLEGLQSILYGNFAVGSVIEEVVTGENGNDVFTFVDRNRARSLEDPTAHAEINVIRKFQGRGTTRQDTVNDTLARKASALPGQKPKVRLFTTLDPCYGCARIIFSAGIDEVVIGAEDPNAGVLLGEGREVLENIPHAKQRLTTLKISRLNYDDPHSPYYVDPKFRSLFEIYLPKQSLNVKHLELSSLRDEYATTPIGYSSTKMDHIFGLPKI